MKERRCYICGGILSMYNRKNSCHFHDLPSDLRPESKHSKFMKYIGIICKDRWEGICQKDLQALNR